VRYAEGDLDGAERAFRRATSSDPGSGAAWNNLAQVLLERGRPEPALDAARRAVELGGPLEPTYRTTLGQIEDALSDRDAPDRSRLSGLRVGLPASTSPSADGRPVGAITCATG
jgi:Flp pilus assembly protein TadD